MLGIAAYDNKGASGLSQLVGTVRFAPPGSELPKTRRQIDIPR